MNKPAFWILSLLGPVLLGIMSVVPYAVTSSLKEGREALFNVPAGMQEKIPLRIVNYEVQTVSVSMEEAYRMYLSGQQELLCALSLGKDTSWTIYAKEKLHPSDSLNMVRTLQGLAPAAVVVPSHIVTFEQEEEAFSPVQQTIALLASILVYFFLFTYSVSLLKGVMEEKSNKVMDIILSSVSPATWIMGKIAGVGLASIVQFLLWLLISYVPFYFFKQKYGGALELFSPEHIHSTLHHTADAEQALGWYDWLLVLDNIHWITLAGTMVLCMILGFVFYAALFAIIGMISGRESDAQPYVLPVTSPLILSFMISGMVIAEPYGTAAEWLSVIPFTAPVTLTLRAGLGVGLNDLAMSMLSLALTSVVMVLLAGKIYKKMLNNRGVLVRLKK